MTLLDPAGTPVQVAPGVLLITPGLAGRAEVHSATSGDMRAAEEATASLEAALASEDVEQQLTVEISDTRELDIGGGGRSTSYDEPAIEVHVPDPGPDWGQLLLYKDEAGVSTWNFPVDDQLHLDTSRGVDTRRYVIRLHVPPAPSPSASRGLFGAVGKKLLKVLAFRLLDKVAGQVGPYFVGRWEEAKRPYRLRSFTPDDYASADARRIDASDWTRLGAGRALLVVHGTLSRTHTAFGSLDRSTVAALNDVYRGRVFAFDHFTLSHDPAENVRRMVGMIPDGAVLRIDIVCHSRGGLVARHLAEQSGTISLGSRRIEVERIVFVGVPNAGTLLVDTKYMSDFLDTYTNLLNFVPDNGVTETFGTIVAVAKQLATGTIAGLDGLQCMHPGGRYLDCLNRGPKDGKRYFAMSSCYEPCDAGWKAWAADRLMDRIFKNAPNDLVVPTGGVFDANGSGLFPINVRQAFGPADGVAHTRFFSNPRVQDRLLEWLR